jgi:hypothetical protein
MIMLLCGLERSLHAIKYTPQHGDRFSKDEVYSIIQNNRDDLHDLLPDMANYT